MNHLATKPGYSLLKTLLQVFSFIIISMAATNAHAQQFTVEGTVLDEVSTPVARVEVTNNATGARTITDANGKFSILVSLGERVSCYKEGYDYTDKEINIREEGVTTVIIPLTKVTVLNEVVIQKQKDRMFAVKHLRDIEETAIYAGKKTEVVVVDNLTVNKATNNARQVYAQIVGLTFNENSDGGLQLNIGGRGLDPNRTSNFNTRQNGYDISADVLGYPESYYTPPVEGLGEIQVIRGAASLQYGTQFGGLVNFKMHAPSAKPIELITRNTVGSYGLLTNFTSLSGTNGKFSYYTFFNYKQGDGFRPNSAFNSRNAFVNLNYAFNDKTSVHLDYTLFDYLAKQPGGLTDKMFYEDMFQSNRTRNWFDVNWNLFALRLKHKFTENADFSLQLFGLDAGRKTVGYRPLSPAQEDTPGTVRDLISGKFVNWGAEARYLQKYTIGNKTSALLIGAKYYQADNTSTQGPGSTGSGPDFSFAHDQFPNYLSQSDYTYPNLNFSLFGENIFRLSDKFTVTPGFRIEHISTKAQGYVRKINFDNAGNVILNQKIDEDVTKDRDFILLGVGLSYKPTGTTEFYGNVSQNYRSVTFSDITTVNPSLAIDPNITDEKGFTTDAGIRGRISDKLTYDTSVYLLYYNDKIGQYLNSDGQPFRTNLGTAITYGWEALVNWNVKNTFFRGNENLTWNAFVNNALTGSEYTKSEIANTQGKKVEFVPLYNLKAGTGAGFKNFLASVQATYISSQFTDSSNSTVYRTDNRTGISGEIPSYFVADFSASYTWRNFKLEAGINNFTDTKYFTRRATGYPGPGILPSEPRTYYATLQIKL